MKRKAMLVVVFITVFQMTIDCSAEGNIVFFLTKTIILTLPGPKAKKSDNFNFNGKFIHFSFIHF